MTKKHKYSEIVWTFLPDFKDTKHADRLLDDLINDAQQMAQDLHLLMDTPLTAETFLTFQESLIDQQIEAIQETEGEIPEEEKIALDQLTLSKAQLISDRSKILASLKDRGLSGRDALIALSRDDAKIEQILNCPHVDTVGGFIIGLLSIATQ